MPAIDDLLPDLAALRRDLLTHPELAVEEHRTAGIVAAALRLRGLEVHAGLAGTGVVCLLAPRPAFASEDFSFMLCQRPGASPWLGQAGNERPPHHPCVDFNDEALPHGVRWLCAVAESTLPLAAACAEPETA